MEFNIVKWFANLMNEGFCYKELDELIMHQSDGVVVRTSASQSVDLGINHPVKSYQKTLKMVFTASLISAWLLGKVVENKPESSLVVSLGKTLNGTPLTLHGRQVAQTPRKWQLPSECGRPVQKYSNAIRFFVNGE